MKSEPLISVIVPVYKVEDYLNRCVCSIVNQTYRNLEIILVDDGSPDECGEMCDTWAKQDARIKVYHKNNGGLSDARNYGTNRANGEFVTYVDSDDWISLDFVHVLYSNIEKTGADLAIGNIIKTNNEKIKNTKKKEIVKVYQKVEALENMLYQKEFDNSACGKLYSLELMKKLLFPVGKLYEDLFTTYKIFAYVDKIVYVSSGRYYYWFNPKSIMNSTFSSKVFDEIEAVNEIDIYIDKHFPELKSAAMSRKFSAYSQVFRWIPRDCDDDEICNKKKKIWRFIKEYKFNMLVDRKARKKNRIAAALAYMGPTIYSSFK